MFFSHWTAIDTGNDHTDSKLEMEHKKIKHISLCSLPFLFPPCGSLPSPLLGCSVSHAFYVFLPLFSRLSLCLLSSSFSFSLRSLLPSFTSCASYASPCFSLAIIEIMPSSYMNCSDHSTKIRWTTPSYIITLSICCHRIRRFVILWCVCIVFRLYL